MIIKSTAKCTIEYCGMLIPVEGVKVPDGLFEPSFLEALLRSPRVHVTDDKGGVLSYQRHHVKPVNTGPKCTVHKKHIDNKKPQRVECCDCGQPLHPSMVAKGHTSHKQNGEACLIKPKPNERPQKRPRRKLPA
jgi:hypothetical protein